MSPVWAGRAGAAVAAHPALWGVAVRQVRRLAPTGWWHRPPFLPLPDRDYLEFRLETMYGNAAHQPEPEDILTWLRWCREFDRV